MAIWSVLLRGITLVFLMACTPTESADNSVVNVKPSNCSEAIGHDFDIDMALGNLTSDITLMLEPGSHCIRNVSHVLQGLANVTITGSDKNVTVTCNSGMGITFFNTSHLTIENITIHGCGVTNEKIFDFLNLLNESIDMFFTIYKDTNNSIAFLCGDCDHFTMKYVSIINTYGLGFLGINVIGNSTFVDISMRNNTPSECVFEKYPSSSSEKIGGGMLLIFLDYRQQSNNISMSNVHIDTSIFSDNSYCGFSKIFEANDDYSSKKLSNRLLGSGGGLSMQLTQASYSVNFTVSNSQFLNNSARIGGGSYVEVFGRVHDCYVSFIDCSFKKNGVIEIKPAIGGLFLSLDSHPPDLDTLSVIDLGARPTQFEISRTNFTDNQASTAGGVYILSIYNSNFKEKTITFDSCLFENNFAFTGSALFIQEWKSNAGQPGIHVVLHDVKVKGNTIVRNIDVIGVVAVKAATIQVISTNVTISGNSVVQDNIGTGACISVGILQINGEVTFSNNTGSYGGALNLDSGTIIVISNNSSLSLLHNNALFGAAVYTNLLSSLQGIENYDCFLYFSTINVFCFGTIADMCRNISSLNVTLKFEGNRSPSRGSMIYGSTLDTCPWAYDLKKTLGDTRNVLEVLYDHPDISPILFDTPPNTTTAVSTIPGSLSLMNDTRLPIEAVPGHSFRLNLTAYDWFGRATVALITSFVSHSPVMNKSLLGPTNYWLLRGQSDYPDQSVPLTVGSDPSNSDEFNVTIFIVDTGTEINILIRLTNCTPGFNLSVSTGTCECDERLKGLLIDCSDDSTLKVPNGLWIGYDSNDTLVSARCHFDYCSEGDRDIQEANFSSQCNHQYNRDGIGCGKCKEGYSISLGSNRCLKCSNSYLSLMLLFSLLGMTIVSVISFYQVSVSDGYLNGVLFFSNIVTLFIPIISNGLDNELHKIFIVPAWLNLDIGVETCFFDGMDALGRAALHFVFPLYLYLLMIMIIAVSKVSQRFASRFNRNGYSAMKLFATLFIMTYSSLLRSCSEVLGFDNVLDLDGNRRLAWRSDLNQTFFNGWHIPLTLLSVFIFACYILPVPFILMFPGIVMRVKFLKKYKPLYDAFWAPFKPKFRFWVGLRLILRIFPFMFANLLLPPFNIMSIGIFLLIIMYLQAVFQPFDGVGQNASDFFFLTNLIAMSIGALFFYVYLPSRQDISSNPKTMIDQFNQTIYYVILAGMVYFIFLILLIHKLLIRFPILKKLLWKFVLTVCTCKCFLKWIPTYYSRIVVNKRSKGYGTVSGETHSEDTSRNVTPDPSSTLSGVDFVKGVIVKYTEIREPLLESSGSVVLSPI